MTLSEQQKALNKRYAKNKKRGAHWKLFAIPPSNNTSISGKMKIMGKEYLKCWNMKGQVK